MVDIVIEPAATATAQFMRQSMQGREVVDVGNNRYDFYIYSDGTRLDYRKSLDQGVTWAAAVSIYNQPLEPIKKFVVHFDQWQFENVGTIIHLALLARGGAVSRSNYYTLDTATDVVTAAADFLPNKGGISGTVGWVGASRSALTLFKSRTGLLHAIGWIDNGVGDGFHSVSADGIVWDDTTHESLQDATPTEGSNGLKIIGVPGNDGDDDDIWVFIMDQAPVMKVRSYDFSALSWNAPTTLRSIIANSDTYFDWGVQHMFATDSYFVVYWNDDIAAGADIHCTEVLSSTTFIHRTDVLGPAGTTFGCILFIDQATGALYVAHLNGSPTVTVSVRWQVSTDGGLTWSAPIAFNEDAPDDHRWMGSPPSAGIAGGRWMPVWRNDDLDDILTNGNNKIEVAGVPVGVPPGPPEIVPPGGTYGPAPGAPPGSIVYITPDLIEYPLVTPHRTGRFVMSFSGFGMAPIQYISQRGPSQDGETVRDFNLTPRVVQVLERQQFKSREAWWDGRADILNDLRPNRQATATAVVTGTLRMVRADGSLRDLNVFIQEGPRFEARNVDEWDEWAFEEVLRFIAHDPLFFDPTRVDFDLAFTLASHLIFPVTLPPSMQFESGDVDESFDLDYTGTWASLPTIVIVGPFDNPIIDNVTTGEKIELQRVIGPGRTVTIDLAFGQKTIIDDLGNNLLGSLSTDSDLGTWHIAPTPEAPQVTGQPRPTARNAIRIRGTNPTGSTSVQIRYFTRYVGI